MKIKVTAEDIKLGRKEVGQRSITHCAVARAIRRQFPKSRVEVGFSYVGVGKKHGNFPVEIARKVMAIMNGRRVRPFTCDMPKLNA
jgi:hypothetical protein